jgi:DNA-binding transcriptional MerR regulator
MNQTTYRARDATGIYTVRNLQEILAKTRGRSVPYDTLKYWRHQIGLTPDQNRLYSKEDLETLKALVTWLKHGGKIPQFVNLLKQRQQHHGS